MIDLRSDTVTVPTQAMRAAMAAAPVGDDVYGEDPTVALLEARVAELLGKEAAVFVPSGTMSNQIALRVHAEPGDMAIMDRAAHMVIDEGGAAAALAGVTAWRTDGEGGVFTARDIEDALGVPHPFNPPHHTPRPRVVCVENTHTDAGGAVWPLETLREVVETADAHGLGTHMDGARLWHATAATGISEREYAEGFDTVSVCLSKGLGAPVGSALAGSAVLIERARRFRNMYGGGLRQSGILAAGALHALQHHRPRLADDVRRAKRLADGFAAVEGVSVDLDRVQSNIVLFSVPDVEAGWFVEACHAHGVHMLPGGRHGVRAVTHIGIEDEDVEAAIAVVGEVLDERGS